MFSSSLCNYHCPTCKKTNKLPNIAGRFYIINDSQCRCNACNSIFDKSLFYYKPNNPSNLDGNWSIQPTVLADKVEIVENVVDNNEPTYHDIPVASPIVGCISYFNCINIQK